MSEDTFKQLDEQWMTDLHERLLDGFIRGNSEAVKGCLIPDVKVWTSWDNRLKTRDEVLYAVPELLKLLSDLHFEEQRRDFFPGGFVVQQLMCGTRKADGSEVRMPMCAIIRMSDHLISRMDEYVDASPVFG